MALTTTARNERIVALVTQDCPVSDIALATGLKPETIARIVREARKEVASALPTLDSLEQKHGVTVNVKPASKPKARKPKARKPKSPLAEVYAGGKATRKEYRDRMKERLGLDANATHPETGKGWTCKQLCEAAKARNIFIDC